MFVDNYRYIWKKSFMVFFLIMCLINDIYVLQELKYTIQSRAKGFNFWKKCQESQKSFSSEWAQTNSYKQLFSFRTWQYDLRFIQITSCITNIQNLD